MKKNALKVAVIGVGYWGKNLARVVYQLDALGAICDSDPNKLEQIKRDYPAVNVTLSYSDVLENKSIDAVAISVPAISHYQLAKKALLSNKDVFVEKPLALIAKEAKELIDLAKRKKRVLMVGHILQYHPAIVKLKEMVSKGELGRIHYIYSNRLNIGKLRTDEDILWSFAPHDISVILMLLDEYPFQVSCFAGDYLNAGINDITLTTLEFKNGVKGHIFVSWLHPFKEQKLIVVGSKAMAVFDDISKEKLFFYPHTIEWKNGKIPVAQKADFKVIPVNAGEPLKLEFEHFFRCILKRKNPKTDGFEGLRVLKILETARTAFFEKKSIVIQKGNENKKLFIHETACVDEGAEIGEGTKIWNFSHILKNSKIGKNCIVGQNVSIGPDVTIGANCKIQNNVSVYKGVILEDGVFCGPSCVFTNVYNPRAFIERKNEFRQTLVKEGGTIGANATIVCGVTIGSFSLVGAGAVVKNDIPDYGLVAGVPARQIGWVCKCGVTLKDFIKENSTCVSCGKKYLFVKDRIFAIDK